MKYPAENLYRETTTNATFPRKNVDLDIDGTGSTPSAGFSNPVPFLSALSLSLSVITMLGALS